MSGNNKQRIIKHLDFFILDLIIISISYVLSFLIKKPGLKPDLYSRYVLLGLILMLSFLIIICFWKIYSGVLRRGRVDEIKQIVSVNVGIFFVASSYLIFTKTTEAYSRTVLLLFFFFDTLLMCIGHFTYRRFLRRRLAKSKARGKMLLISTKRDYELFVQNVVKNETGEFQIVGVMIIDGDIDQSEICGIPVVPSKKNIVEYVVGQSIENVMMHVKTVDTDLLKSQFMDLGVNVYTTLMFLGSGNRRYQAERMNGYDVLSGEAMPAPIGQLFIKRAFDIIFSATALVCLSPVFLLLAFLIKKEDKGPVFYVSKRIGKDGKVIGIHKFRSMKINADKLEDMLTPEQLKEYYKEFKLDNDPRCTKIGSFMRKASLDELPQFWDVFVGRLSLVGPRPVIEAETRLYGDKRSVFLSVKPGLTGYWQARGRNNITYESGERQSMELYYVENHSLFMDLKIILWTVVAVLKKDGAK